MWKRVYDFIIKMHVVWKSALAAGLSWHIAQLLGTDRPYFAPLAAILCVQVTVQESLLKGYQRVLGIVGGVMVAELAYRFVGVTAWSIALLVLCGTGLATWLRFGRQAIPQVGVSAMMVLTVGSGQHTYAFDRIFDTILGALIAVAVNMLVLPVDYSGQAWKRMRTAANRLAGFFDRMADWFDEGGDTVVGRKLQTELRDYLTDLHDSSAELKLAVGSLRYNPLLRRHGTQLAEAQSALVTLRQGYAHLAGMMRTAMEWVEEDGIASSVNWAWRIRFLGDTVREWTKDMEKRVSPGRSANKAGKSVGHGARFGTNRGRLVEAMRLSRATAVEAGQLADVHSVDEASLLAGQDEDERLTNLFGDTKAASLREYALMNDAMQLYRDFQVRPRLEK